MRRIFKATQNRLPTDSLLKKVHLNRKGASERTVLRKSELSWTMSAGKITG